MTAVSKGVQNFNKLTRSMLKDASNEGKNITKAQVTEALGKLTADGKVSKADRDAAQALLEKAPLTAGAKEALANFVEHGNASGGSTRPNNPLNARLRHSGGSESGGRARGGSESGGSRRGGGGEGPNIHPPAPGVRPNRGGGEYTPSRPSYGGGESRGGGWGGGGGGWSRGGGE